MAKECSFDVVSEFDKQELANAIDQTKREVGSRFDLKDSGTEIELDGEKSITINTSDDMKLRNVIDILQSKLTKRNLSIKILDPQKVESALGGKVKQIILLRKGLSTELAKKIAGEIKSNKFKAQASIQGDAVRVSGKDKDELQEVIKFLRSKEDDFDAPLQFNNYR
jgi:cyclic-di-GMP-binding protein